MVSNLYYYKRRKVYQLSRNSNVKNCFSTHSANAPVLLDDSKQKNVKDESFCERFVSPVVS